MEDLNETNTIVVDSILYPDDDAIDEYCDKGVLSRYYCDDCGSRKINQLSIVLDFG